MTTTSRRQILKNVGLMGLGLLTASIARAAEGAGALTPAQTEGPFYPVQDQADKDTDLTIVKGHSKHAKGQVVRVTGQVRDEQGNPLAGAMVEIWQACESGKYNHPEDTNTAPMDPDFQYWGRTTTDANGNYGFLTIKPGAYPADANWIRPPHIHFKVAAPGFRSLTTQLYFAGDPLNDKDRILRAIPADVRQLVISKFTPAAGGALQGRFDITIPHAGSRGGTPELD